MKKIAIICLAALLLLCLASCDDKAREDGAFSTRATEEQPDDTSSQTDTEAESAPDEVWTPFF